MSWGSGRRPGPFDGDPQYEALRRIREDEGYTGWLDQDNNRVPCPSCNSNGCTARITEPCN